MYQLNLAHHIITQATARMNDLGVDLQLKYAWDVMLIVAR